MKTQQLVGQEYLPANVSMNQSCLLFATHLTETGTYDLERIEVEGM